MRLAWFEFLTSLLMTLFGAIYTIHALTTVDREIFVLKIICALKFHGAKFS